MMLQSQQQQQQLTDLDFDAYFDVSNNNPALYEHEMRVYPQQPQFMPQQAQQHQQSFGMYDWCMKQQAMQCFDPSQPTIKEEQTNYTVDQGLNNNNKNRNVPVNSSGLSTPISDMNFPGTPQSQPSASLSPLSSFNATSPIIDPPLLNAFNTIDQWTLPNNLDDSYASRKNSIISTHTEPSSTRFHGNKRSEHQAGPQLKKVAHNAIERRYRNNINDRIRDLKNVVPALYKARVREKSASTDDEEENEFVEEYVDGVQIAKKLNKATILHKATEYIHHLKYTIDTTNRENQLLQQILAQLPGGNKVLTRFQKQKCEYQRLEQIRIAKERKLNQEHERAERQRELRERAAQRAALAKILPKPQRRPYKRRALKQTSPSLSVEPEVKCENLSS